MTTASGTDSVPVAEVRVTGTARVTGASGTVPVPATAAAGAHRHTAPPHPPLKEARST